ncbi:MAG: HigA family addiction module antitoxin [Acidobacteriota bacterium]
MWQRFPISERFQGIKWRPSPVIAWGSTAFGSTDSVNDIVRGKRAVTADTALRLARYFGTTPQFWMNLQANYDLELAQDARGAEIAGRIRSRQADTA